MLNRALLAQVGKNVILIGVVAGAYFVFGLLGLLLRVPGDSIGTLMPESGVALAATLVFGKRVLLSILIGSLAVNAWSFDFNPAFLPIYIADAVGAALSAFMGASLVRRMMGFQNPLLEGKRIIIFMLLGGPISCLLSATISIPVMYGFGVINQADVPLAWVNWWMGDILGVLILTPLILILFAEPQNVWSRRRKTVALPIVLTLGLVISLFFYLSNIDRQQYIEQLKEKTITLSQALKNRIQLDLYSLHALKNFLLGSPLIDPQEVLLLTNQMLFSFKEIKLISWINVTENIGETSQFISAFSENQHNKPETLRLLPPELRKKMLGNSPYTETEFLIPEKNGFKLAIPVVKGLNQKKKILGIIIASVSLESLVYQALDGLNTANCSMTIRGADETDSDAKTFFTNVGNLGFEPYQTIPIQVADKKWLISFYHDMNREKNASLRQIEWILLSGLWFTGILGIVLLHLTGRYFRTEAIIEERTQILTQTKISAESANQAKNQFLAKISHELRTPLNGISGFAQLLEKKPSMSVEDKKQIGIIKQCSDNLLKLINEILDISAIESQQINIEINEFNFTRLLKDCVRICKFKADEKGLTLITKNTCLIQDFLGDEKRIRQILVNLIDNAIKYTSKGNVVVAASHCEDYLKITVADTGCGIAKDDLERIFSPFVQVRNKNFSHEGIGLGLAITKELISLMNGDLKVKSRPDLGSVFSVSLPLSVSRINQDNMMVYPKNIDANYDEAQVLVVDDSEINLLFLVGILEQLGCKVDSAIDGQQALVLIKQNNYDLVLVDINMPIMNGFELVRLIRKLGVKTNVVAVSAYADDDKIKDAFNAGFDAYLTKPIEEYQLVELLGASLQNRHTRT